MPIYHMNVQEGQTLLKHRKIFVDEARSFSFSEGLNWLILNDISCNATSFNNDGSPLNLAPKFVFVSAFLKPSDFYPE